MYYCKVGGEFLAPPRVDEQHVESVLGKEKRSIVESLSHRAPLSLDDTVEMYAGPKRKVYQRALESLNAQPVTRRDAVLKSFVKREKCNVSKAPRVIQPRNPRYNLSLGRYIKPLEHPCYRAIQEMYRSPTPVVMKGFNLDQIGNYIADKFHSFRDPVALSLDATKFDMHVSVAMLKWEHSIYREVYSSPELSQLLRWQLHNTGEAYTDDGVVTYTVDGRRMSGDMNTALGNCLIMSCMVHAFFTACGVRHDLANNGDDCVVFMERADLHRVVGLDEWFYEMGFRMTVEDPVYDLERIEFCQMHPVFVGGGYRMVRNPATAIEKDVFCVKTLEDAEYWDWLHGIGVGGLSSSNGVPIMQQFYSLLRASGGRVRDHLLEHDSGMRRMIHNMSAGVSDVSEETRFSFYLAFGIMPADQLAIEEAYADMVISRDVGPLDCLSLPFANIHLSK